MIKEKVLALTLYLGAALAGAAVGVSVDRLVFRAPAATDAHSRRSHFFDQLHLTQAQRDSATAILDARDKVLKAVTEAHKTVLDPIRAQQDSVMEESRSRISNLLTPEQRVTYEQMRRDRAQRAAKH